MRYVVSCGAITVRRVFGRVVRCDHARRVFGRVVRCDQSITRVFDRVVKCDHALSFVRSCDVLRFIRAGSNGRVISGHAMCRVMCVMFPSCSDRCSAFVSPRAPCSSRFVNCKIISFTLLSYIVTAIVAHCLSNTDT